MGMQRAIAEVRKARAALSWNGDSDLAERLTEWLAEQEPKTVTLHHPDIGTERVFSSITKIEHYGNPSGDYTSEDVWRVDGRCFYEHGEDERGFHDHGHVTESPADVTIAARKVFGEHWSCPGAEPPVVLLPSAFAGCPPIAFCYIDKLQCERGGVRVFGTWHPADNDVWRNSLDGLSNGAMMTSMPKAGVIAACATTGVPCPPEEKPTHFEPEDDSTTTELLTGFDPASIDGDETVCVCVEREADGVLRVVSESTDEEPEETNVVEEGVPCPPEENPDDELPTVSLHHHSLGTYKFASIQSLEPYADPGAQTMVYGIFVRPDGRASEGLECVAVLESENAIRALCAEKRVPCPLKEKPEPYHPGPFVGYDPATGRFLRLTVDETDNRLRVASIGTMSTDEETTLREEVRESIWNGDTAKLTKRIVELEAERDEAQAGWDTWMERHVQCRREFDGATKKMRRLQEKYREVVAEPEGLEREHHLHALLDADACMKQTTLRETEKCQCCGGRGNPTGCPEDDCPSCNGTGLVVKNA